MVVDLCKVCWIKNELERWCISNYCQSTCLNTRVLELIICCEANTFLFSLPRPPSIRPMRFQIWYTFILSWSGQARISVCSSSYCPSSYQLILRARKKWRVAAKKSSLILRGWHYPQKCAAGKTHKQTLPQFVFLCAQKSLFISPHRSFSVGRLGAPPPPLLFQGFASRPLNMIPGGMDTCSMAMLLWKYILFSRLKSYGFADTYYSRAWKLQALERYNISGAENYRPCKCILCSDLKSQGLGSAYYVRNWKLEVLKVMIVQYAVWS